MKSHLFDLPNELFFQIFQHLSSSDLIESFFRLDSLRLRSLLSSFIVHLDLSNRSEDWLNEYLPHVVSQFSIESLRCEDRQINSLVDHFSSMNFQSLEILNSDWTTDLLKNALDRVRQRLKQLKIIFTSTHGQGDIAQHIFQSDASVEHLIVTGRFLYFQQNELNRTDCLKYLSIELEDMQRLFDLLQNLPQLEDLKVKFRSEKRIFQTHLSTSKFLSLPPLRHVIFTGSSKYFDQFESFFSQFGSTIESLSIHMDLMFYTIDGQHFEQILLKNMPKLSSLNLIIHSTKGHADPNRILSFQSSIWQQFDPIVYWFDARAHQQTIFTLPYQSDRFKDLSNDSISSWISNRSVSLCFDRVRCLSLCATTPLTCSTIRFVREYFPHVEHIELTHPSRTSTFEIDDQQLINEDFLHDQNLTLKNVKKFSLFTSFVFDDYQTFQRLISLLPNLVSLQMYIGRGLYRDICAHEHEHHLITKHLSSVQHLQMVRFYDEKNILTDEEIHHLFPHAVIQFDYDDI